MEKSDILQENGKNIFLKKLILGWHLPMVMGSRTALCHGRRPDQALVQPRSGG